MASSHHDASTAAHSAAATWQIYRRRVNMPKRSAAARTGGQMTAAVEIVTCRPMRIYGAYTWTTRIIRVAYSAVDCGD
jgi:hypothetical protein